MLLVLFTLAPAGWASVALATAVPVAGVEIETGVQEMEDTDAGAFWGDLDTDLSRAIDDRLTDRLGEGGAHVRVRIDRVALDNAYEMMVAEGAPFLEGRVTVIGPTLSDSQPLRVSAAEVMEEAGDTTPQAQYDALIAAFADAIVAVLD
ncbi:hypothetical protein [Rhodobaculum claviforme]|uniref:hypothetical protein n=1 Tax=Rhodobaculum claviforme TaxID=1549854 RepID=UPI001912DCEE|nr:hypothetical protein [Rhodobaculum claviforme]